MGKNKHLRRLGTAAKVIGPVLGFLAATNLGGYVMGRHLVDQHNAEMRRVHSFINQMQANHAQEIANLDALHGPGPG